MGGFLLPSTLVYVVPSAECPGCTLSGCSRLKASPHWDGLMWIISCSECCHRPFSQFCLSKLHLWSGDVPVWCKMGISVSFPFLQVEKVKETFGIQLWIVFLFVNGKNSIHITVGISDQSVSADLPKLQWIYTGPVSTKSLDTFQENRLYKSQILSGLGLNIRMWAENSTPMLMIWLKQSCCSLALINVFSLVLGRRYSQVL